MQRLIPRLGDIFQGLSQGKEEEEEERESGGQVRQTQYDGEKSLLVASRVAEEIK